MLLRSTQLLKLFSRQGRAKRNFNVLCLQLGAFGNLDRIGQLVFVALDPRVVHRLHNSQRILQQSQRKLFVEIISHTIINPCGNRIVCEAGINQDGSIGHQQTLHRHVFQVSWPLVTPASSCGFSKNRQKKIRKKNLG